MASFTDIGRGDVLAIAPALVKLADSTMIDVLAYVNELNADAIGGGLDGPTLRMARLFLAAHLGTTVLLGKGGISGPVTSESAGGLRRSYGFLNTAATRQALAGTLFGQQYLGIIEQSLARVWVLL